MKNLQKQNCNKTERCCIHSQA